MAPIGPRSQPQGMMPGREWTKNLACVSCVEDSCLFLDFGIGVCVKKASYFLRGPYCTSFLVLLWERAKPSISIVQVCLYALFTARNATETQDWCGTKYQIDDCR